MFSYTLTYEAHGNKALTPTREGSANRTGILTLHYEPAPNDRFSLKELFHDLSYNGHRSGVGKIIDELNYQTDFDNWAKARDTYDEIPLRWQLVAAEALDIDAADVNDPDCMIGFELVTARQRAKQLQDLMELLPHVQSGSPMTHYDYVETGEYDEQGNPKKELDWRKAARLAAMPVAGWVFAARETSQDDWVETLLTYRYVAFEGYEIDYVKGRSQFEGAEEKMEA